MYTLGISAYYHDSAAAIVKDGIVLAAAQEERFTRVKNDASFPHRSILFCLDYVGLGLDEIDVIIFYDKPFLKFERILENFYSHAPKGIKSFILNIPKWIKSKLFLRSLLKEEFDKLNKGKAGEILFSTHHLSHAAGAFFTSPFLDAAILTIDGVGEWTTTGIYRGEGKNIEKLYETKFPDSLGLFYSAFTYFLGFKVNEGEYKVMGLSSYGNRNGENYSSFYAKILEHLITVLNDGSFKLNLHFFAFQLGTHMVEVAKWEELFNLKKRKTNEKIEQIHCDFALAAQDILKEIILKLCHFIKAKTKLDSLCLSGGVALNCVINGEIKKSNIFKNVFIQPAAGDSGGAIGAALAAYHIYLKKERINHLDNNFNYSLLGSEYPNIQVKSLSHKYGITPILYNDKELSKHVAEQISEGKIVGWFQGRMEFGPRALGNRSILANPRIKSIQKKINIEVKGRESFRPFAPAILEEDVSLFYDNISSSPYMLMIDEIKDEFRFLKTPDFEEQSIKKKSETALSHFPAITHVDYTSRLQTVSLESNLKFHNLLMEFKKLTGVGMLLNTSFNRAGEPIIESPKDALDCFLNTEMDILVINNYIYTKKNDKLN